MIRVVLLLVALVALSGFRPHGGIQASISTCPQGTSYVGVGDGFQGAQASGSVSIPSLFTTYTGTNFSAHRPPWNVPAADYAVGYTGTMLDPTVGGNMPSCATLSGSGTGPYSVSINAAPCTLSHLDFSLYSGMCITVGSAANGSTVTFDNDHFAEGTNCNPNGSGLFSVNTTGSVVIQYSEFDNPSTSALIQGMIQNNTGGSSITVKYSAFMSYDQAAIQMQQSSTVVSQYNYVENIGCCGNHGDYLIGNAGSGTTAQSSKFDVIFAKNGTATADYYVTNQNGGTGVISNATAEYDVMLGATNAANGYLINLQSSGTVQTVNISNNYMGQLLDYGFFDTTSGGGTISGPVTCTGNIDMSTGANATGTLSGTTCN